MSEKGKVVLAYSGGLDTSCLLKYLQDEGYDVVSCIAALGQPSEERKDIDAVNEKAKMLGAVAAYDVDIRDEFCEDFVAKAIFANGMYENKYPLLSALSRPAICRHLVKVAQAEGAVAIAHGCTGKGNDQVRFELAIKAFAPDMQIIAPWRIWNIKSREEEIEYAEAHNIPLKINRETNYSKDKNLWHLSHEGLDLEDPANEPQYNKPGFLEIGQSPEQAPDKPTYITISFEKGVPVAVDGEKMDGVTMIEKLNKIGGENGVGLADIVENRLVGMKSRGVYENPAGSILYRAHEVLETLTLDRDTMHYKEQVALRYAELVYFGQWFTPLREALAAFVDKTQERVTGDVKLKLYKGNIINAGTTSPYSLYSEAFATFDEDDVYDQKDSAGFINLFGLPIKVKAILDAEREAKA